MKKFENMFLEVNHNREVMPKHIQMLDAWGEKGWELAGVAYPIASPDKGEGSLVFFLKREIQQSSAPAEEP